MTNKINVDRMTFQYLHTALRSSSDDGDKLLDSTYGIDDISLESMHRAVDDCQRFVEHLKSALLYESALDYACSATNEGGYRDCGEGKLGHDFWLTRCGHGAGFWDGDYGDIGDEITEIVKRNFNELYPYVGDDGMIYTEM